MLNPYQKISKACFSDLYGNPFDLTTTQSEIFRLIYEPSIERAAITTPTQYGKSDVTAQAVIAACIERPEKVLIIAPTGEQAHIIMGYIIDHLFDNPLVTQCIVVDTSLERLKHERSKDRITFKNGSEVRILTADVRTLSKEGRGLMGFGATIVIVDESSLIPDNIYSKILRMIGGVRRGKIVKLGNPFEKNHFYRSLTSKRYQKVWIDYRVAIAEGRLKPDFVEEAREDMPPMDFTIFYEVKFPEGGAEDALIPLDWIEKAIEQGGIGGDKRQVGVDVARFGRDKTIYLYRRGGNVVHIKENNQLDTMQVVGWVQEFLKEDKPDVTAVDVVGIGSGVYDRLGELDYPVVAVNVGESPSSDENKKKFFNLRAELFWHLREMFRPEGDKSKISIPNDNELIRQLTEIRYFYSSERKIRIEDKEDMKRRIGQSPDKADALSLAFYDQITEEPTVTFFS